MENGGLPRSPGFLLSLERFLGRTGRIALASAVALSALPACEGRDTGDSSEEQALIGNGAKDWAQNQGQRDPAMVSFYGQTWHAYTNCGPRGGCAGVDLFIKLRVRPNPSANLDAKRIGIVYRAPTEAQPVTVTGTYFTTWDNGDEEWHVKVYVRTDQGVISFNAWYQDGAGSTYYDDNGGALHAVNASDTQAAIQPVYLPAPVIDDTGIHGKVAVRIADLGYDKDVEMVYSTDGWQTVQHLGSGEGENAWHWTQDWGADFEQWEIDLNLPGQDIQTFDYAMVYRHGMAEGTTYEFWANNGGSNFHVAR